MGYAKKKKKDFSFPWLVFAGYWEDMTKEKQTKPTKTKHTRHHRWVPQVSMLTRTTQSSITSFVQGYRALRTCYSNKAKCLA